MSSPPSRGPRRLERLAAYAPLPLVAVAVLLVVLILITPVLVSTGQPAPGILTQAELVVDRLPNNPIMHFYVHGLGATVRYARIWFGLAGGFNWSGSGAVPWSRLNWSTWQNASDILAVTANATANPIAVNITAFYQSSAGSAWYAGVLAFYVSSGTSGEALNFASDTSGIVIPGSVAVGNSTLPLPITLATVSPGGPP